MTKSILTGLISFIILSGCTNSASHQYLPSLTEAGLLAETAPDSAYRMLQLIESPEELPEHDFAYWCLISGEIFNRCTDHGKNFLPSLYFERANRYYQQHGTTEQQLFIRLYLGRSYHKAGEYNQAMQIYTEALNDAKTRQEYNVAGIICSYMGDIYQFEHLSDKCKEKYNESLSYFSLANNQKSVTRAYNELGFEYLYDEQPEEGLNYLLQADSIANLIQDSILISDISYSLGIAYCELDNFYAAEQSLLKVLQFAQTKTDSIIAYYALNSVYIASGDYSKAREVLDLGLNELTKDGVLRQLYLIEKGEENFELALMHLEQYQKALDSIQTEQKKMHTFEIEQKYNLEHSENIKSKALVAAQRNYIVALIAASTALLVLFIHQVLLRRKNRIILGQKEELNKSDLLIAHVSKQLKKEKEVQQKLEERIKKSDYQNSAIITEQQQRIDALNEELFLIRLEKVKNTSSVSKKIIKVAEKVTPGSKALSSDEWKTLKELFQTTYPSLNTLFHNRKNPLTEAELRHCILTLFNIGAKGEAIIMNILPDSVYRQRTRVRQKLDLQDGINLFEFFKAYCIEHE